MSTSSTEPLFDPELASLLATSEPGAMASKSRQRSRLFRPAARVFPDAASLVQRVQNARHTIAVLDSDTSLCDAPSEAEIQADIDLAAWTRAQFRRQRKKEVRAKLAARDRARRTDSDINRQDDRYLRWSDRARAAQRRATNPDALSAMAHQRAVWSSWALRAVVVLGLAWSAVNVGRNLMPDSAHVGSGWQLQWALGFGVEAMISVPILVIMVQAATAARLGKGVRRTHVVVFEAGLLLATVALNAGPHLLRHEYARAAQYSVVPVMVAFLIWLHAHVSADYGRLVAEIPEPDDDGRDRAHPDVADVHGTPAPVTRLAKPSGAERASQRSDSGSAPTRVSRPTRTAQLPLVPMHTGDPRHVAAEMVRQSLSMKSVDDIAEILSMAADRTPNGIADEMSRVTGTKWSRSTVDRILDRAQLLRAEQRSGRAQEIIPAQPA